MNGSTRDNTCVATDRPLDTNDTREFAHTSIWKGSNAISFQSVRDLHFSSKPRNHLQHQSFHCPIFR